MICFVSHKHVDKSIVLVPQHLMNCNSKPLSHAHSRSTNDHRKFTWTWTWTIMLNISFFFIFILIIVILSLSLLLLAGCVFGVCLVCFMLGMGLESFGAVQYSNIFNELNNYLFYWIAINASLNQIRTIFNHRWKEFPCFEFETTIFIRQHNIACVWMILI